MTPASKAAVLSVAQCYAADRAAAATGLQTIALMERAGQAVAATIRARRTPCPVAVLCGPGNNGGDGFVVARLLNDAGWPVRVGLLGPRAALKGDAAIMAGRWSGPVEPAGPRSIEGAHVIVDALFGAGLARPLDGAAASMVEAMTGRGAFIVAVDVPSGLEGDSGAARGPAARADTTVTFFRRKPAHVLLPGRSLCGEVIVADIGIPESVLDRLGVDTWANDPELWEDAIRWPGPEDHKYSRGHALLVGGGATTSGAGRLAAEAALLVGAGAVTVAVSREAAAVHAAHQTAAMIALADDDAAFAEPLADERRNALLIGPGAGVDERTRSRVRALLATGRPIVLDADALTVFAGAGLPQGLGPHVLLTPHDGEYRRLFDHQGDRLTRARQAATDTGAIVLLKGSDTVIAAPDGRAIINGNAPPWLATAGAGDVLAGVALGLMAQGLGTFEAAAAAAWLHGRAAAGLGPGMTSEALLEALPAALRHIASRRG